ncbi:DDE-type integrase/transposase/recombinase [Xanthomonas euvesicatoria]|uniref:DDE-type integrase/transposase/recombinase n=1 Tax=Xanthomonas euvesicatoria TaxID=456327 RepID=UPI0030C7AA66
MPLTSACFGEYASRLNLSDRAVDYVSKARSSAPARRVESNEVHNTVWRYPSAKMGIAVALESSEEFTFALQLEYDEEVLEYWEQPPSVPLVVRGKKGRLSRCNYVPDFLVLKRTQVEVVQVKPAELCERLARERPHRWTWSEGVANDTAASERFRELGLNHLIYSNGQAHKIRAENFRLLLHVRDAAVEPADARRLCKAIAALSLDAVVSMRQLILSSGVATATPILRLVEVGELFADLDRWRLSAPDECFISRTKQAIEAHASAMMAIGGTEDLGGQLSSAELLEVHHRLLAVRGEIQTHRSPRSVRRWKKKLEASGRNPLDLRPHHRRKGNRTPRLSDEEESLLSKSLCQHYLSDLCTSRAAAYSQYLVDHQEAVAKHQLARSSAAVTYPTYIARIKRMPVEELAAARSGRRAAAAAARPVAPSSKHLSPVRAFERAHVDHYLCDIHIIIAEGRSQRYTRRPQLTAMRDEATGAVLAISIGFSAPSRQSCLAVIRDCVRRHGRLPETIVVDNGAEFHSEYFEVVLARLGVAIQRRPPGNPRYGGTIEGWFHSLKAFLSAHRGNTNNDARGRSATAAHKGWAHAAWSIFEAYDAIERFAFELFNGSAARNDLESRSIKNTNALALFPESGSKVAFGPEFLALTSMPIGRSLKLDLARGIRHLGRWYTNEVLFGAKTGELRLKVFEEPWDRNTVYALVDGALVPCRHGSLAIADLERDFTPALESIRHLQCPDVRAALEKEQAIASAKLTRKLAQSKPASSSKAKRVEDSRRRAKSVRQGIEPTLLKTEYWA